MEYFHRIFLRKRGKSSCKLISLRIVDYSRLQTFPCLHYEPSKYASIYIIQIKVAKSKQHGEDSIWLLNDASRNIHNIELLKLLHIWESNGRCRQISNSRWIKDHERARFSSEGWTPCLARRNLFLSLRKLRWGIIWKMLDVASVRVQWGFSSPSSWRFLSVKGKSRELW